MPEPPATGNAVVELVQALCRDEQRVTCATISRVLAKLLALPKDSFATSPSTDALTEVHRAVHQHLDQGHTLEALIFCSANLVAAGQARNFEIAEWMMGCINSCLNQGIEPKLIPQLLQFVEQTADRYEFEADAHSRLGLLTLVGNLAELMAAQALFVERVTWLQRACESFRSALRLAPSLAADLAEITHLRMALGRTSLSLFELGGSATEDYLQTAAQQLERSSQALAATGTPSLLAIEIERLLAACNRAIATLCESRLSEPALPAEDRHTGRALVIENLRQSLAHLQIALQLEPESYPQRTQIQAGLHQELAETQRRLAAYDVADQRELLLAAQWNLQQALAGWTSTAKADQARKAQYDLCRVAQSLWTECHVGDFESVKTTFQQVLTAAQQQGSDFDQWRIAARYGRFLMRCTPEGQPTNWNLAYDLMHSAVTHLRAYLSQQPDIADDYLRMIRESTTGFWEYCFLSAGQSGHIDELPRIFEARTAVSSKLSYGERQTESLIDRAHIVQLLPPQAVAIYMLQGDESFQAVVVHQGQSSQGDYIHEPAANWESVRAIVDPWMVANQRMRRPQASHMELDQLQAALTEMLTALCALIWQRIDDRLQALDVQQLFIMRGRGLNILPLHAIVDQRQQAVLDKYQISYVSSARMINQHHMPMSETCQLLAVANPYSNLPCTEPEISFVAKHFAVDHRKMLVRREATREAIITQLPLADVFHYAGHAVYDLEARGIMHRGEGRLLLADGSLLLDFTKPLELYRRPVVILSACETGRTDWRDLESLGIADYFISCGARAVIATIWQVDDISTTLLMHEFYQRARQAELSLALQQTQQWLRALERPKVLKLLAELDIPEFEYAGVPDRPKPYAHPYYWAPFFLSSGCAWVTSVMYTIYDHPADYPQGFVVRRWKIEMQTSTVVTTPLEIVAVEPTLEEARQHIPAQFVNLGRLPESDPKIAESWVKAP